MQVIRKKRICFITLFLVICMMYAGRAEAAANVRGSDLLETERVIDKRSVWNDQEPLLYSEKSEIPIYSDCYPKGSSVNDGKELLQEDAAAMYRTWVEDNLEIFGGQCIAGTFATTGSITNMQPWLTQTGVISVCCMDLNQDGQEECLVCFLKQADDTSRGSCKVLYLATLQMDTDGTVVRKEIALREIDVNVGGDTRIYIKEKDEKKYMIVQCFTWLNGCSDDIYVFHLESEGAFYLDTWLCDYGDTEENCLIKRDISGTVEDVYPSSGETGPGNIILYCDDLSSDRYCSEDPMYGEALNGALELYGLSAIPSVTLFGRPMWLLDETKDMTKISQIYGDLTKQEYEISDYTGWLADSITAGSAYIISDSDKRYLSLDELSDMPLQVVNYAKNEIYARRGRIFQSMELQEYFDSQSWYSAAIAPEDFGEERLNDYERTNAQLLSSLEHQISETGYQLDQPGYTFEAVYDYLLRTEMVTTE